jgi:energy-coupling factor transporter ATP-binding protein EcfA2
MKPFKHAAHFYGREPEITKLVQRVRDQRQTFVIGASGCGKSSLVFAGLIPALSTAQPGRWITVTLRPGDAPLLALHQQLKLTADTALPPADYQVAVNTLLGEPPSAEKLLVVVDQFEECFIQAAPDQQKSFFEALNGWQLAQCAQVFTLRSDFYGEFQASSLASTSAGQISICCPYGTRRCARRSPVRRRMLASMLTKFWWSA